MKHKIKKIYNGTPQEIKFLAGLGGCIPGSWDILFLRGSQIH